MWRQFCTTSIVPAAVGSSASVHKQQGSAEGIAEGGGYQARLPQLVPRLQRLLLQAGSAWQDTTPGMLAVVRFRSHLSSSLVYHKRGQWLTTSL